MPPPVCTINAVLFRISARQLQVALVRRGANTTVYANTLALPGGAINTENDQTLNDTLLRHLKLKTGIRPSYTAKLEFEGNLTRDPQGWSITCPYLCLTDEHAAALSSVHWFVVTDFLHDMPPVSLPFDHQMIIQKAFQRLYNRARYSTEPNFFFRQPFTLSELQTVYEVILGKPLHKKNFRDRIDESVSVVETGETKIVKRSKAKLYTHTNPSKPHFFSRVLQGALD
ncbi:NUDIX hydrolase [Alteromonas sp. 14N.309.X.WAT.G.H12]|uniref:NUDIX hydrolase n=1 Tax=Alteromonas sp. 14N.309.X.WAT.G.H12 TaxID=3120824 RepID=UPI002FCFDA4D